MSLLFSILALARARNPLIPTCRSVVSFLIAGSLVSSPGSTPREQRSLLRCGSHCLFPQKANQLGVHFLGVRPRNCVRTVLDRNQSCAFNQLGSALTRRSKRDNTIFLTM